MISNQLLDAVLKEDISAIFELVSSGHEVNASNELGETPLSFACAYNCFESARALISLGANVNAPCEDGLLPLDFAMQCCDELIDLLVQAGASRGSQHLPTGERPTKQAGSMF